MSSKILFLSSSAYFSLFVFLFLLLSVNVLVLCFSLFFVKFGSRSAFCFVFCCFSWPGGSLATFWTKTRAPANGGRAQRGFLVEMCVFIVVFVNDPFYSAKSEIHARSEHIRRAPLGNLHTKRGVHLFGAVFL